MASRTDNWRQHVGSPSRALWEVVPSPCNCRWLSVEEVPPSNPNQPWMVGSMEVTHHSSFCLFVFAVWFSSRDYYLSREVRANPSVDTWMLWMTRKVCFCRGRRELMVSNGPNLVFTSFCQRDRPSLFYQASCLPLWPSVLTQIILSITGCSLCCHSHIITFQAIMCSKNRLCCKVTHPS